MQGGGVGLRRGLYSGGTDGKVHDAPVKVHMRITQGAFHKHKARGLSPKQLKQITGIGLLKSLPDNSVYSESWAAVPQLNSLADRIHDSAELLD